MRLPSSVNAEIQKMVLAISRKQMTQEQAMQHVANYCLSPNVYPLPPADANGKRPRLFYWEEAENAWCPAEGLEVDNIIGVDQFAADGDIEEIRFKRQDMTDAEFAAIPEG